jgi:hypothetical protein
MKQRKQKVDSSEGLRGSKTNSIYSSETEIVRSIFELLDRLPGFFWRNTNQIRNNRRSGNYIRGVPDILGVYRGRAVAFEVKQPKGVVSEYQVQFLERFNREGGAGFIVHSPEEVKEALRRLDQESPQRVT